MYAFFFSLSLLPFLFSLLPSFFSAVVIRSTAQLERRRAPLVGHPRGPAVATRTPAPLAAHVRVDIRVTGRTRVPPAPLASRPPRGWGRVATVARTTATRVPVPRLAPRVASAAGRREVPRRAEKHAALVQQGPRVMDTTPRRLVRWVCSLRRAPRPVPNATTIQNTRTCSVPRTSAKRAPRVATRREALQNVAAHARPARRGSRATVRR